VCVFPGALICGVNDCFADFLSFECISEGRMAWLACLKAIEEVCHLVDKRVLISDGCSRNPPTAHVGMISVGHVDGSPAAKFPFVAVIKVLETGQIVQIPTD